MKYIKRISLVIGIGALCFINMSCLALGNGGIDTINEEDNITTPSVDGNIIEDDPINGGMSGLGNKMSGIIKLPQPENYETSLGYVLSLLQIIVNWFLGMLAVIALVYTLYCGFCILTAGSDDKSVDKGKKGIKTAAIALAGIGLSWLIVSFILRFITKVTETNI